LLPELLFAFRPVFLTVSFSGAVVEAWAAAGMEPLHFFLVGFFQGQTSQCFIPVTLDPTMFVQIPFAQQEEVDEIILFATDCPAHIYILY